MSFQRLQYNAFVSRNVYGQIEILLNYVVAFFLFKKPSANVVIKGWRLGFLASGYLIHSDADFIFFMISLEKQKRPEF